MHPIIFATKQRILKKELAELEGNGYIRIDEPTPAPAIGGRRVVFLMHPAAGMLELLEEK